MIAHLRKWLAPGSASERILVDGHVLRAAGNTSYRRSMALARMKVYIPDCRSYVVEYRREDGGEFVVHRDGPGRIVLRSLLLRWHTIPVCWLPPGFAGCRVHRYIVRVDERRVRIRAGTADSFRIRLAGSRGTGTEEASSSAGTSSAG